MKASTLECTAFCLILGLGACADGLAAIPGGMAILLGGIAFSGLLVHLAHTRGRRAAPSAPQSMAAVPLDTQRKRPAEGKQKAAAVVATPQRQVKQSRQAIISRPYFIGAKGVCQMETHSLLTAEELATLLRVNLRGIVPDENINIFVSQNFETGDVSFNLKIRYPSMSALCPMRAGGELV